MVKMRSVFHCEYPDNDIQLSNMMKTDFFNIYNYYQYDFSDKSMTCRSKTVKYM